MLIRFKMIAISKREDISPYQAAYKMAQERIKGWGRSKAFCVEGFEVFIGHPSQRVVDTLSATPGRKGEGNNGTKRL
jgi:hypothetical protein